MYTFSSNKWICILYYPSPTFWPWFGYNRFKQFGAEKHLQSSRHIENYLPSTVKQKRIKWDNLIGQLDWKEQRRVWRSLEGNWTRLYTWLQQFVAKCPYKSQICKYTKKKNPNTKTWCNQRTDRSMQWMKYPHVQFLVCNKDCERNRGYAISFLPSQMSFMPMSTVPMYLNK